MVINRDIACCKTTRETNTRADTSDYVSEALPENYKLKTVMNLYYLGLKRFNKRTGVVMDPSGSCSTLLARNNGDNSMILETCLLKNKGTEISKITDNANTLMARDYKGFGNQEMNAVISLKRGYEIEVKEEKEDVEGVDILGNYSKSDFGQTNIINKNGVAPTVTENHGQVTAIVDNPFRIRKLTPKECFALMGVKQEDFERCAKNQSDSSLYHLAGDSIVTNVIGAIIKEMV